MSSSSSSTFFMVQHNITDTKFYEDNVYETVKNVWSALGPGLGSINEGLLKETDGTLYQHSVNLPIGPHPIIGWCIFESKPGSDWTCEKLKIKQDTDKKEWAVQDVYEIIEPAGVTPHFITSEEKKE
jgi:hypothetical protein